jgi:hypothetical protein
MEWTDTQDSETEGGQDGYRWQGSCTPHTDSQTGCLKSLMYVGM